MDLQVVKEAPPLPAQTWLASELLAARTQMIAASREHRAPLRESQQWLSINRACLMLWVARCAVPLTPVADVIVNPVKFPQFFGRLAIRLLRFVRYRRGGRQTRPIWLFLVCFVCIKAAAASLHCVDATLGAVLASTFTLTAAAVAQVIGR
jgi:hypothetical protein